MTSATIQPPQPLRDLFSRGSYSEEILNECWKQESLFVRASVYSIVQSTVFRTRMSTTEANINILINDADLQLSQLYRRLHRTTLMANLQDIPMINENLKHQLEVINTLTEIICDGRLEELWKDVTSVKCNCLTFLPDLDGHDPISCPWDYRIIHDQSCPWESGIIYPTFNY